MCLPYSEHFVYSNPSEIINMSGIILGNTQKQIKILQ